MNGAAPKARKLLYGRRSARNRAGKALACAAQGGAKADSAEGSHR
jgi:hypothetical protein